MLASLYEQSYWRCYRCKAHTRLLTYQSSSARFCITLSLRTHLAMLLQTTHLRTQPAWICLVMSCLSTRVSVMCAAWAILLTLWHSRCFSVVTSSPSKNLLLTSLLSRLSYMRGGRRDRLAGCITSLGISVHRSNTGRCSCRYKESSRRLYEVSDFVVKMLISLSTTILHTGTAGMTPPSAH
jgi:hypothetical protein